MWEGHKISLIYVKKYHNIFQYFSILKQRANRSKRRDQITCNYRKIKFVISGSIPSPTNNLSWKRKIASHTVSCNKGPFFYYIRVKGWVGGFGSSLLKKKEKVYVGKILKPPAFFWHRENLKPVFQIFFLKL